MSRNISSVVATIFHLRSGFNFHKRTNTRIVSDFFSTRAVLHGNTIARLDHETGDLYFDLCGHNTPTTRDRLRAIGEKYGISVSVMGGKAYYWRAGFPVPMPDKGEIRVHRNLNLVPA